ncbi:MAG TPA: NAD-dependent epimerase/dehydratase family protein [Chloroflexota bacterium]
MRVEGRSVVVTGATGFVGSHLVEALVARGDRVRCLVRASSRTERLRELDAELATVSLDDPAGLRAAVGGAEVVYHVAGLIKAVHGRDYVQSNVVGTRNLARACATADARPRRLVLVSSQAAAGPARPERPAREDDPPHPVSAYGQSKLAAEREALAVSERLEVAIARPSTVYGPRDEALRPLFRLVRWRIGPELASDPAVSLIYVGDLVELLLALADHPAAVGRVYFAAGSALRLTDIVAVIGDGFGRRPWRVPVPSVALVGAGVVADLVSVATGRARPFGRRKALEMLHSGWVCSPARAAEELGFRATTPPGEGFRRTAAWYREHGWR